MSTPTYDPSIIRKHAADLYNHASNLVFLWSVFIGGIFTAVAAAIIFPRYPSGDPTRMGAIVAGVIGLMIGYAIGSSRAFSLRLQAQMALCQVAMEFNTRNRPQDDPLPPDQA